jgi:hypothetical protein
MKAAKEATDRAKKAAEDAKRAYDELLSNIADYHELQNTLDGLVEGTEDWRDALDEVNALVLELLQTYPELARYLTVSDGRLGIDDAGLKDLEEKKARG